MFRTVDICSELLIYLPNSADKITSNPKQPSCKKQCGPQKGYGEKRCEIQGGSQEMAVMVG